MPCELNTTEPAVGDNFTTLLQKWLQAVGETFECGESEWTLLAKILTHYGGTPKPGDPIVLLWEKLRRQLGDEECNCGNAEWNAIKSVLDSLGPGSFAQGDARYNLVWKILEAAQSPPVPTPDPPEFVNVASANFSATASPVVNYPTVQSGDIMLAIFSTNTIHNSTGSPPVGWTKLNEVDETGADSSGSVFWRRASGAEPASETWTSIFDATETGIAVVVAYRKCIATGSPIDGSLAAFGSLNFRQDTGPVVTTQQKCMMVGILTLDPTESTKVFGWDAGIDERFDGQAPSAAAMITIGDKVNPSPSSITLGGNFSPTADSVCKFLYALKPVPV